MLVHSTCVPNLENGSSLLTINWTMVEKVFLQKNVLRSVQLWCPHILPHNVHTMFAVQHQVKSVCNVSRSTLYKLVNKHAHTDKLYKRQMCTESYKHKPVLNPLTLKPVCNGVFSTLWLPSGQEHLLSHVHYRLSCIFQCTLQRKLQKTVSLITM